MTTDINDLEQQKALDHIRELMSAHWCEAQDAQDDDGKFGIGLPLRRLCGMRSAAWRKALPRGAFKVNFDRGASPTKLKVTCRISKTFSDEIESVVEDPQQPKLL